MNTASIHNTDAATAAAIPASMLLRYMISMAVRNENRC
jgi:hypothetical protein